MSKIKRLIVSLLTCLMLVTGVGFNVVLADDGTKQDSQSVILSGPFASTEGIDIPEEYATKVANIATNFAWAFSGGGKFLMGACISGGVVGIFDVVTSILKEVIYFGPSAEESFREQLMDKLESIDASITDVSNKVDAMQDTLNAAIKKIDADLDQISIKLDKQNINNVATIASSLRNEMNNYNAALNNQLHIWYDNTHYENYITGSNFIIDAPYNNGAAGSTNSIDYIAIDKDVMKNAITAYVDDTLTEWNSDNKEEIVKTIFGNIFDDLDKTNTQLNTWLTHVYGTGFVNWDSFTKKDEAKEKFSEAAYQSLCIVAAKNIAKAYSSGAKTYVSDLIDKFTLYCNYLTEADDQYTSPFVSQYNIYSSLYAFQGDLNAKLTYETTNNAGQTVTVEEDTNLLDIARQKYISELNELGTFVGLMAKASGNYGETTDMRSLIYLPWAKAEKYTNDKYNQLYKMEGRFPVDNYCYITDSKLKYQSGNVTADLVMNFYAWENGFGTDIKSYRKSYMENDFTFSIPNNSIVDSTNMSLIYAHYLSSTGDSNLRQHLLDMKAMTDFDARMTPNEIITNFVGASGFSSADKVSMFIKNCHNNPDKWSGKDFSKGDVTTVTSSSSHFVVRRKASADVFDLTSGTLTNTKRIGAVASFYEKYTFKDDLVVFWDAEYNNPTTVEERKSLAALDNFYWRQRYDKKSDDEERYNSYVNYRRRWGALVSVPVNSSLSIDEDAKSYGKNESIVLNSKYDSFKNELKEKRIDTYEDYLFDDTYRIYFNAQDYVGEVDKDVYNQLVSYLSLEQLEKMVDDYYTNYDKIKEFIDFIEDKTFIDIKDEQLNKLIVEIIEQEGDCKVVETLPNTDQGCNVYLWSTGKFYMWDGSKYVEYKEGKNKGSYNQHQSDVESLMEEYNFVIKDTLPIEEVTGKNVYLLPNDEFYIWSSADNSYIKHETLGEQNALLRFAGKDFYSDEIEDNDKADLFIEYPDANSTDYKFKYDIKPVIAYELFFKNETDIDYKIHILYDIKPVLYYKDGGEERRIEVSNAVLEQMQLGHIEVIIPILELIDNDNMATVYHFSNLEDVEYPIETLTGNIKSNELGYYTTVKPSTFSPFAIADTYHKTNKYIAPVTGVR